MRDRMIVEKNIWDPAWLHKAINLADNLMNCLDDNSDKLVEALDRNSKSSSFLAWVGMAITIIWAMATGVWARYTYLSYIK